MVTVAKAGLLCGLTLGAIGFISASASATPVFPRVGDSTLGPAIILTITNTGVTETMVSSQTYDGSDDVLVGLINNSSTVQTSLMLSGSGNGGGIFAFDGDGITTYIDANTGHLTIGNPADTTGYAGPGVTFTNINASETSGDVDFSLATGQYTYFGLESSPSTINGGGGIMVNPVPEPASVLLLAFGLVTLGFATRLRRL